MKDRVTGADLVFMPYNYLIDEEIRKSTQIDFSNSVIIFDEGHNVPQTCEQSASFSIDTQQLEQVPVELKSLQNSNNMYLKSKHEIFKLINLTKKFEKELMGFDLRLNPDRIQI